MLSQLVFFAFIYYGYRKFVAFEQLFSLDATLGGEAARREEQAERQRAALTTDLKNAQLRRKAVQRALLVPNPRPHV